MELFATKEEADACTEGVDKCFSCPKMPLYSDSEDSFTSEESYREDVYVVEALYNRLMAAKTDSRFVQEAAVAIFSTAGLAGHSVTGAMSNQTKTGAKPALDKTKYSVLSGCLAHWGSVNNALRWPITMSCVL
ncbi:hypothetical protein HPB49_023913 [Dermacentor silvarum]|uniref:Uncharacterized protein n=1 Tax=Dermacentor silvarum TaxID=543639 RepID=A0ACB8DRF4_DERSI|nr:hypothetical protein HPB49_023913 [Dermacentor silvarum]